MNNQDDKKNNNEKDPFDFFKFAYIKYNESNTIIHKI